MVSARISIASTSRSTIAPPRSFNRGEARTRQGTRLASSPDAAHRRHPRLRDRVRRRAAVYGSHVTQTTSTGSASFSSSPSHCPSGSSRPSLRALRPRRGAREPLDGRRLRRRLPPRHRRHVRCFSRSRTSRTGSTRRSRSCSCSGCSRSCAVTLARDRRAGLLPPPRRATCRTRSSSAPATSGRISRGSSCSIPSTASTWSASSTPIRASRSAASAPTSSACSASPTTCPRS